MTTGLMPIPRLRKVYKATYANLPTSGIKEGDLGYATDRLVFYRWSGSAWEAITSHSSSGTAANIPTTADMPEGSLYYETDTAKLKQIQSAAWVEITSTLSLGTSHSDAAYGDHTHTLAEDVLASGGSSLAPTVGGASLRDTAVGAGADVTLATCNDTFDTNSRAVGVGAVGACASLANTLKVRLYMGGVQVAESAYLAAFISTNNILTATKALSGAQTVYIAVHNYDASSRNIRGCGYDAGGRLPYMVAVGSIKI